MRLGEVGGGGCGWWAAVSWARARVFFFFLFLVRDRRFLGLEDAAVAAPAPASPGWAFRGLLFFLLGLDSDPPEAPPTDAAAAAVLEVAGPAFFFCTEGRLSFSAGATDGRHSSLCGAGPRDLLCAATLSGDGDLSSREETGG